MPELPKFKSTKKEFSKVYKEWQWTYSCLFSFTFNKYLITEITITDHYQIEHKDVINNELILNILREKVNSKKRIKPLPNNCLLWGRDVFRFETVYQDKNYRLIFLI